MSYLPKMPAVDTWRGWESRLWNNPPKCGHGVQTEIQGLAGNPLCMPLRGSQGEVLLSPKIWNGCHRGQELAIGTAYLTTHCPFNWWPGHTNTLFMHGMSYFPVVGSILGTMWLIHLWFTFPVSSKGKKLYNKENLRSIHWLFLIKMPSLFHLCTFFFPSLYWLGSEVVDIRLGESWPTRTAWFWTAPLATKLNFSCYRKSSNINRPLCAAMHHHNNYQAFEKLPPPPRSQQFYIWLLRRNYSYLVICWATRLDGEK